MDRNQFSNTIKCCIQNGNKLLADAQRLEFEEPPSTKAFLSIIAQEEFAKAFLLYLCREQLVPWNSYIRRALNEHVCKQLVGVILDYLNPEWETLDDLQRFVEREVSLGNRLPSDVASAINILRHEKVGRWAGHNMTGTEHPSRDPKAIAIAKGKVDKTKQDALYVRVGKNGSITSTPDNLNPSTAKREFERAERFHRLLDALLDRAPHSEETYKKVVFVLNAVFSNMNTISTDT